MGADLPASTSEVELRLRAETDLREHEAFLQEIIDNAGSTIFVKDLEGRFRVVNSSLSTALARPGPSLVGERYAPEDGSPDPIYEAEVIATGERVSFDTSVEVAGKLRHFLCVKFPLHDPTGEINAIGTIYTDVTDEKQAQLDAEEARAVAEVAVVQAEESRDRALAASRAKGEFLSRMSHELRTPLNSIIGFGQLLERRALAADEQEWVAHVVRAGQHLLDLIDEVLDLTRVDAGHKAVVLAPVDLRELIVGTVGLVRPAAAERSIVITTTGPTGDDRIWAAADRQHTVQILLNLLMNAILYNHEGGTVRVEWHRVLPDRVELVVRDSGPGIAAELLDRVFEPFDRLGAEQLGVEGTGLGLPLSRNLAEEMDGTLRVASHIGTGSTFTLCLPAAKPFEAPNPIRHRPSPGRAAAYDAPSALGGRALSLLYIEDDIANLRLVEQVLEMRPRITMLSATRGRVGLDVASRERPDVVLVDLHLPDIDGFEVVRLLRRGAATVGIPIIAISAYATPARIVELQAEGIDHYLRKPIDIHELIEVIDGVIARREGPA